MIIDVSVLSLVFLCQFGQSKLSLTHVGDPPYTMERGTAFFRLMITAKGLINEQISNFCQ